MNNGLSLQPDLLAIAERDTHLAGHGKERHGPCPFCGGRDRFWIRPEDGRYFCRRCTPRGGDAITYIMQRDRLTFRQALAVLAGTPTQLVRSVRPERDLDLPPPGWRSRAERLCAQWADCLWSADGARALAWLRGRGLADETIAAAGLGYCSKEEWVAGWHYLRSITIPIRAVDGQFYGVWRRMPVHRDVREGPKRYLALRGSKKALYGVLRGSAVLLVTEGYLDCLLAAQTLSGIDVATMNLYRPDGRWLRYLLGYRRILVCLDEDDAGQGGWSAWGWMGTARRVALPAGKDITQAIVDHGVDLAAWLAEQVGTMEPPVPAPQAAPIVDAGPEEAVPSSGPDTASIPAGEDRWLLHADERYF